MLRITLLFLFTTSVIAAPVPKETPKPPVLGLKQAFGKSHLSKEVRVIGRQLGEDPIIKYSSWRIAPEFDTGRDETHFYLIWNSKGIDMNFDEGKLTAVFLYNSGADEHKRYVGELPEGLSFEDDLKTIEKKLGKPTSIFEVPPRRILGKGPDVEEAQYSFDDKGLEILMQRPTGGRWAIHWISIQKTEKE